MNRTVLKYMHELVVVCVALALMTGCGQAPDEATGAKTAQEPVQPGIVVMTPEEIKQVGIEVKPVKRSEFRDFREFPGTVKPNFNALAEVTSLVRGRVIGVFAELGQEVKAGDMLALLKSKDLAMAQSTFLKSTAKLFVAKKAWERAKFLVKEKVIGRAEFQRREGELISARADAREARDRLLLLGMAEHEIKKLQSDQMIRPMLPIPAPFDGRVIARNLTIGEVVEPAENLFKVANLSTVWVEANIPERDIEFLHRSVQGDRLADVELTAYAERWFQGSITYVGDVLDPSTRTVKVRVEVENPKGLLKPEMFASVRIHAPVEREVLTIPSTAVLQDQGHSIVFVQRGPAHFERRPVKIFSSNGERVKVLEGLKEGEKVVIKGAFVLKSELAAQTMEEV